MKSFEAIYPGVTYEKDEVPMHHAQATNKHPLSAHQPPKKDKGPTPDLGARDRSPGEKDEVLLASGA